MPATISISTSKSELEGLLHGTTTNKIRNLDLLLERAGRNVLSRIDPSETRRIAEITNGLYDEVFDYAPPSDLKSDKIIDIRPQANRSKADNYSQVFGEEFDLYKEDQDFTLDYDDATRILRISKDLTGSIEINSLDSTTANGT